jgi:hypothetical protein
VEIETYLRYSRELDFFATPDYEYCRNLFKTICDHNNWTFDDKFDWSDLLISSISADNATIVKPTTTQQEAQVYIYKQIVHSLKKKYFLFIGEHRRFVHTSLFQLQRP